MDCTSILPGAVDFQPVEERPFWVGQDGSGETVGWIVLSTKVVDIPAYSSKPLVTLVGLDTEGVISGARVVHHSEPILLTGIPESRLTEFVDFFTGRQATDRIVVGHSSDPDAISIDVISGATVTALAQNRTIMESARSVGAAVGVVDLSSISPGHFVRQETPLTWEQMLEEEILGHLVVSEEQMDERNPSGAFVDLWFTIADAPQVGLALMAPGMFERLSEELEPGQHIFVIFGNGSSSFKGSAFVRGGQFDRVRVDQRMAEITFRDTDYHSLSQPPMPGAPSFREGAAFITRGGNLDPGTEFDLVFLGSRYDGRGGFTRDFREFRGTHQLPRSLYMLDGPDPNEGIWVQAWRNNFGGVIFLSLYLLFVIFVFAARKWTTADKKRIKRFHISSMVIGLVGGGILFQAQPSVTQALTLIDSLLHEWRWELFASEPLIFIMWIFIFIVSLIWGRGVFCGWVCPYGAGAELLRVTAEKLKVPEFEFRESIHKRLVFLRYFVLAALVAVFLYDSLLGEQLAELEPFKSSFFVPFWTREWYYAGWWVFLAIWSVFTFRPFCRYLCPLGGGLALFNSFRLSGPKRRSFCTSCTICTTGCEPKAIRPDGTIDARECLSCMDCEANYMAEEVCPPLIGIDRLLKKAKADGPLGERDAKRLAKLEKDRADV